MDVLITECGAVPDGKTLATKAIAQAIAAIAQHGGGRVVIPPGRFLTGMVRLCDHMELHFCPGSELIASPNPEDHLPLLHSPGAHGDLWHTGEDSYHLIAALGLRHIRITGSGIINANGTAFYPDMGGQLGWPLAHHKDWRRPGAALLISKCQDVVIEDITIGNVANWTCHLHESDRIRIRGLVIENPGEAPNADGIDITGCRGVSISDCNIDTCDDAICLKTMPSGRSCENIAISNCVLRTSCVALKLGCTESFHDMRNVTMSNCTVRGSHRAVGLYSVQGAVIENIAVDNVVCDTRTDLMFTRPIHMDLRHGSQDSPSGAIRNVRIAGLLAETNGRCLLTAESGAVLEDIILRDVVLRYPCIDDPVVQGQSHGGSQFSNTTPWARVERAALVAENVRRLMIDGLFIHWPTQGAGAPNGWQWQEKLANGSHTIFRPADWTPGPDCRFAAVSARNVQGGHLDARHLQAQYRDDTAVRLDDACQWPVFSA
ncbi:MAG: hypothetical protein EA401_00025 [Planctomycetota bacterium]|nr:MAG: hypothetical protein EA401_00025 [Planctomycetota bacterium]